MNFSLYLSLLPVVTQFQISGYCGYSYYDETNSSGFDDIKNANILMGFAAMCMALVCALELVLGFLNMDNNTIWHGGFLFTCFVCIIFQIASASLATSHADDTAGDSNLNANQFFLYGSPLAVRIMMGVLKFHDYKAGAGAGDASMA